MYLNLDSNMIVRLMFVYTATAGAGVESDTKARRMTLMKGFEVLVQP